MKKQVTYVATFETVIDGQHALTEVDCGVANPSFSRTVREDAQKIARASFAKLSPQFTRWHPVRLIEIVKIVPNPEGGN